MSSAPSEIAIERGEPGSVMSAYNRVNGDWCGENDFLLNRVLKGDWAYPGWVMSDWGGCHSTAKAALAGLDGARCPACRIGTQNAIHDLVPHHRAGRVA